MSIDKYTRIAAIKLPGGIGAGESMAFRRARIAAWWLSEHNRSERDGASNYDLYHGDSVYSAPDSVWPRAVTR